MRRVRQAPRPTAPLIDLVTEPSAGRCCKSRVSRARIRVVGWSPIGSIVVKCAPGYCGVCGNVCASARGVIPLVHGATRLARARKSSEVDDHRRVSCLATGRQCGGVPLGDGVVERTVVEEPLEGRRSRGPCAFAPATSADASSSDRQMAGLNTSTIATRIEKAG